MGSFGAMFHGGQAVFIATPLIAGASIAICAISLLAVAFFAVQAFRWRARNAQLRAEVENLEQRLAAELESELSPVVLLETDWTKLRARYNRHAERFSLVIMDIGDALRPNAALRSAISAAVTHALGSSRRIEDSLYQLDHRTFAALLSRCGVEGSRVFVDRVRTRLSNEPLRDESGTTYITVTAGVAEWDDKFASLPAFIDAACADRESFSDFLRLQLAAEFTGESAMPPSARVLAS